MSKRDDIIERLAMATPERAGCEVKQAPPVTPIRFQSGELTWSLSCWNWSKPDIERRDATESDLVACLLANPELRVAVLEKMPEYRDLVGTICDECGAVWRDDRQLEMIEPHKKRATAAEAELAKVRADALPLAKIILAMAHDSAIEPSEKAIERADRLLAAAETIGTKDSKPPGGSTRKDEQCNAYPEVSPVPFPGRESGGADAPFTPGGAGASAESSEEEGWCARCGHQETDHPRNGRCGAATEEGCDCPGYLETLVDAHDHASELPGGHGPVQAFRRELVEALRELASLVDADLAPRHIAWQKLASRLERGGHQ